MKNIKHIIVGLLLSFCGWSCKEDMKAPETPKEQTIKKVTAKDILGNPDYLAISYGGYRMTSRDSQPTIPQLKEDMKLLHAMDIKVLRTYNVQLAQASNILKAIKELKEEDASFEMYVMLGAWIDCLNAWTELEPNHNVESPDNAAEIDRAVKLAQQYPDIVKIIAVGNEAMVKWATSYYVQPDVILKWVNHLQNLKATGTLSKDLWITSSDNFASWGGGENQYHVKALEDLIQAVDYLSVHTYPMHDTHYNPAFWGVFGHENERTHLEKIDVAMLRAKKYAMAQTDSVASYMKSLGIDKPIHIGETGWASASNGLYGPNGSKATDEYKEALYYEHMRDWTNENGMSCFYFEAFDEPWKDAHNSGGSENHFGLFTVDGKAKYALWKLVDQQVFKGLTRNGNPITKTYNGDKEALLTDVLSPPEKGKVLVN
ncbi:glycosyl hydrolase family 17 protein [Dokdonia pacifica]|uniref:Endo-1,3-beta-glucanase btgC n=1 Tax=Dokdonia pacifica TaxID=1627892 RepID=A0A238ZRV3_9FLAO|nr:glycosyl hydrolase family 17 protein [Dokdonia pacifica]SNR86137.1 Exo-beta-1,3-glucanase, GH17 family [Dokdonia pacifica]